jgi:3D (Asp-Asp-Asp) domain-containing protein
MIKVNHAIIILLLGLATAGWFCTNILDDVLAENKMLRNEVNILKDSIVSLEEIYNVDGTDVVATIYHASSRQTDSTPHITADGTRIDTRNAGKYRYVAVSRNLLERWGGELNYGDYVIVANTDGKFNGVWQVKDTMNERYENRIDFLCSRNQKIVKFDDAKLYRVFMENAEYAYQVTE